MLQFNGRNITSEFDLLRVKVQAMDFIKPLKFEKTDQEKLGDLIFELTKELIFKQTNSFISLNIYKLERKKGLEINVLTSQFNVEKTQKVIKNNYNLAKKGISLDKNAGFLDEFDLRPDIKSGTEIRIMKWLK